MIDDEFDMSLPMIIALAFLSWAGLIALLCLWMWW